MWKKDIRKGKETEKKATEDVGNVEIKQEEQILQSSDDSHKTNNKINFFSAVVEK